VWAMDRPDGMVHVFDITGLPARPPRQIANIALGNMDANEAQCSKSCLKEGWVQFSRDGRYVYVGDTGAVVNAHTKRVIAHLPELRNSRKHIEVDWYRGRPVWGSPTRSQQGYVR
jgi:CTP:molybdopterin cytidylyltransferase MocA